ncbi:hypothetical protein [Roseateles chitinivorans]|uniref:hypothetical protein n=1 Tax=Roseateles chitinivorans TaxID=2917965 RepID=UPI0018ED9386|nr:hypothetical protein [Roseateles chitinivorans]
MTKKSASSNNKVVATNRKPELLASHPISSLIAVKRTLTAPHVEAVRAALAREDALLEELLGAPPNMAALAQFVGKRD